MDNIIEEIKNGTKEVKEFIKAHEEWEKKLFQSIADTTKITQEEIVNLKVLTKSLEISHKELEKKHNKQASHIKWIWLVLSLTDLSLCILFCVFW